MSPWVGVGLSVAAGYLIGAIPFGLIVSRLTRGVDLRDYGSHRTGATNALRTIGLRGAAAVFVLDLAKGTVVILLARLLVGDGTIREWAAAGAGVAAIVGHIWSVYIRFSGGRGVATSTGALLGLAPIAVAVLAPVVALTMWRWRYVSLGSIGGALLAPVVVALLAMARLAAAADVAYAVAAGLLVTAAHADNIARLRAGTERRIGQKEAIR